MTLIKIDPNTPKSIIKDRLGSMLEHVKRFGTSQPEEEWAKYSNPTTYKGFACVIAEIPRKTKSGYSPNIYDQAKLIIRFKGIAKELYPAVAGGYIITYETPYCKNIMTAGKELYKLIDRHRKVREN